MNLVLLLLYRYLLSSGQTGAWRQPRHTGATTPVGRHLRGSSPLMVPRLGFFCDAGEGS